GFETGSVAADAVTAVAATTATAAAATAAFIVNMMGMRFPPSLLTCDTPVSRLARIARREGVLPRDGQRRYQDEFRGDNDRGDAQVQPVDRSWTDEPTRIGATRWLGSALRRRSSMPSSDVYGSWRRRALLLRGECRRRW